MMCEARWRRLIGAGGLVLVLAGGLWIPGGGARAMEVGGLEPLTPQPAAGAVKAGLRVEYNSVFVRHVDDCVLAGIGRDGGIIEALDWANTDGEVLTSGDRDGVCARMRGLFHFPKPGAYIMVMQSNDGVRLTIGGKVIVDDPDVHGDQFSQYATVKIAQAGWYKLFLIYFERKATSTVELYWQPPGAKEFTLVPASAYGHLAK